MKRILIVKLWAIGDILLATPLLRALKRAYPDCEISWLVEKAHADVLCDNPLLDEVIAFDSAAWRRHWRYARLLPYARMTRALRALLRARRFDAVINLSAEKWWAWWFNVAPVRVGLFPRPAPGLAGRAYTHALARGQSHGIHNTRHYLGAAAALGVPGPYDERLVVGVSPASRDEARAFLQADPAHDPARPLVVLHPGTSQNSKCWLPEHYAALAAALSGRCAVVLTGSPRERALAEAIAAAVPPGVPPPRVAAGAFADIRPTVALIEAAAAVVTGDTSALHVASALGTPLVGVYGSTRPGDNVPLFGPRALLHDDSVRCAPCYKPVCPLRGDDHLRCQRAVTPGQVLAALDVLLKETHALSPTG